MTESGSLYTGITTDLERRLQEHHKGKRSARFFALSKPHAVVYQEMHASRSVATKRELQIKGMSRHDKLILARISHQRSR